MDKIEDQIELLEKQYFSLRESVAKLEKVQYKIREQIGFIEYMAKGPDYPSPLEVRMQEITKAVEIIQYDMAMVLPQQQHSSQSSISNHLVPGLPVSQPAPVQQPTQYQHATPQHVTQYQQSPVQPTHYEQPTMTTQPQIQHQEPTHYEQPIMTTQPQAQHQALPETGNYTTSPQMPAPAQEQAIKPMQKMRQEVQSQIEQHLYNKQNSENGADTTPAPILQNRASAASQNPTKTPSQRRKTIFRITPR